MKQSDSISTTLFAIYINDLAEQIKRSGIVIQLDENIIISILMYADDIVLLSKDENDMQELVCIVEEWCFNWRLEVILTKTNVMHVRGSRRRRSCFVFLFNIRQIDYCETYRYLGVTLNEFLDFNYTAKVQAEAAGRALGSKIAKTLKNGGLPYKV